MHVISHKPEENPVHRMLQYVAECTSFVANCPGLTLQTTKLLETTNEII